MVPISKSINHLTWQKKQIVLTTWSLKLHFIHFYNPSTQESRWEAPPELAEHEIHALPGAARYLPGVNRMAGVPPEEMDAHRAARAAKAGQPGAGQVRASHILAKHTGSRRPSSWRQVSAVGSEPGLEGL